MAKSKQSGIDIRLKALGDYIQQTDMYTQTKLSRLEAELDTLGHVQNWGLAILAGFVFVLAIFAVLDINGHSQDGKLARAMCIREASAPNETLEKAEVTDLGINCLFKRGGDVHYITRSIPAEIYRTTETGVHTWECANYWTVAQCENMEPSKKK